MADNTVLNLGSGGDSIRTDDIGGTKWPVGKAAWGADGSATLVDDADGSRLPVNVGQTVLASGAATSAKQDTGNTSIASIDGKTPALGQALAAASVPVVLTAAQQSALTPPAAITGFATETTLGTRLSESDFDTKVGGLTETAPATDTASSGLNGRLQRLAQRLTTMIGQLPAALNGLGNLKTSLADLAGTAVDTNSGNKSAGTQRVVLATDQPALTTPMPVQGGAASGATASGNPVLQGLVARTAAPTAVTDGQAVNAMASSVGKQVVLTGAVPQLTWSYAAAAGGLVNTTGVTAQAAGGAGVRNYVKSLQVINSHATISTEVVVRDGAAGTVLHRGWAQAAGGGYAVQFDPPLRGSTNTLVEIAEVTATATTGVLVNLQGYTAGE